MQLGVVFPQTELGAGPGAVRAFAEAAEGSGYAHIALPAHVGAISRDVSRKLSAESIAGAFLTT